MANASGPAAGEASSSSNSSGAGAAAPTFPDPEPLDHGHPRDRLLDDVLGDALDTLAIRWE